MALARHGLTVEEREISNFLPLDDRTTSSGWRQDQAGGGEVLRPRCRTPRRLWQRLDVVADLLRDLVLETPPNAVSGRGLLAVLPQLFKAGKLGRRIARLPAALQQEVLNLFTQSAGDYLDQWFESDPIKAAYGFDGIVGNFASPYTPGSAYVLLLNVFGE